MSWGSRRWTGSHDREREIQSDQRVKKAERRDRKGATGEFNPRTLLLPQIRIPFRFEVIGSIRSGFGGARFAFAFLIFTLVVSKAAGQPGDAQIGEGYALSMNNALPSVSDSALPAMNLAEIEEEISRRRADVLRYEERLAELLSQNEEVRHDLEQRASVLHEKETVVRARIMTLCRLGRGGYVQLLRGANSWSDLIRRSQLVRSVVNEDLQALRTHQHQVETLESQQQELDSRMQAQQALSERIALYQQELESEAARRQ